MATENDRVRKARAWPMRRPSRSAGEEVAQATARSFDVAEVSHQSLTWVNVGSPSLAEMEYLKERFGFHPLALEDCLSRVQLPKVDEYDDPSHLFLVLHFPVYDRVRRINVPSQVSIFVGQNYVVTVHQGDLRPLVKLFLDCQESAVVRQGVMGQSVGFLLYRILDGLVDYCFPILNKVMEKVDELEGQLSDVRPRELVTELGVAERDIISYRRIVRPQIGVLELLERREYPFLKLDPDVYFGDLADHMRRIWVELENLKDVMDTLYNTHYTLSVHRTNRVVEVLTIVGTMMLPPLIISSLYGMNVSLPLGHNPQAFGILLGISVVASAVMLVFFRFRRWI